MRQYEKVRFYVGCPRCGAKPDQRCVTQDQWAFPRSNHPERNRKYAAIHDSLREPVAAQQTGDPR